MTKGEFKGRFEVPVRDVTVLYVNGQGVETLGEIRWVEIEGHDTPRVCVEPRGTGTLYWELKHASARSPGEPIANCWYLAHPEEIFLGFSKEDGSWPGIEIVER